MTVAPSPSDRAMLRWLWSRLLPWRRLLVTNYLTSALSAVVIAAALPVTELLLASLVACRSSPEQFHAAIAGRSLARFVADCTPFEAVERAAVVLLVLKVASGMISYVNRWQQELLTAHVGSALRRDMFSALVRLPADFFDRTKIGEVTMRFGSDHATVMNLYPMVFFFPAFTLMSLATTSVSVLSVDPWLGGVTLATIPVFAVVLGPLTKVLRLRTQAWRAAQSVAAEDVQETMSAIREVKAHGAEAFEEHEFEGAIGELFDAYSAYTRVNLLSAQVNRSISELVPVIVLALGAWHVRAHPGLDAPRIVTLFTAVPTLLALVASITGVRLAFDSGVSSARSIAAVLGERPESAVIEGEVDLVVPSQWDTASPVIAFRDVTCRYEETDYSVRGLTFDVYAGETVALVGAGGAGKSTVLALLFKLRNYASGSITIYGQELRELSIASVRRAFGVMPQFPFFFGRSVMKNIAYGIVRPEPADFDRARHLCRKFELDPVFAAMPAGYDTEVTARGANFSGSQQKRIALCRALMKDPPMLLLDEPLSGLSNDQSDLVLAQLASLRGAKVMLMVTHDVARLEHVDRVLVFDRVAKDGEVFGAVVEQGSVVNLLEQGTALRRLREGSNGA
jgi:ABC-type multidrug transport system fused ATPase/permease subunit